jgi:ATP-dependent RNA helicase MSS116
VSSPKEQFAALLALIEAEYAAAPKDFKAIVFGTTANGVALMYDVYKAALPQFKHFELHSRMSQPARTSTTTAFKNATSGILFASDVVGRGMDFPNTGLVVQLGLPSAEDQYIHRVGRTARTGKDGRAVTILFSNESFFVRTNPALPIKEYPTPIATNLSKYQTQMDHAFAQVDELAKAKAYQAFLGYNKTYLKKLRLDAKGLVQLANGYAMAMGCAEVPLIEKQTVGKMGLKGVPGLNIGSRKA